MVMRILSIHNHYQQSGGEDTVAKREADLLRRFDHQVFEYRRSNTEIEQFSPIQKMRLPLDTIWSRSSASDIRALIREHEPDIAHFHNTFPLISPSAYYACCDMGVPVVQSLHNPRLMCLSANFYRDEELCTDCLGRCPWPGVIHGCYRDSRMQSATVATMLLTHRLMGTWKEAVSRYIVFTKFYQNLFVRSGLPAEKIAVKPHFVSPDPGESRLDRGEYALFLGRLDPEKGVKTLLRAWRNLPSIPLKIRGAGKLRSYSEEFICSNGMNHVEIVDRLSQHDLLNLIKNASFLVWPSEGYYETFGLVAIEAYACGVPVIASRTGVMAEIVQDNTTGLHFEPGNPEDLCEKARHAWNNEEERAQWAKHARLEYEQKYTPSCNYELLMRVYHNSQDKPE